MKVLIVVDMQNDFIDGSLGTKEAVGIVDRVAEVMDSFDGAVICTRDTHFADYLETSEGKTSGRALYRRNEGSCTAGYNSENGGEKTGRGDE